MRSHGAGPTPNDSSTTITPGPAPDLLQTITLQNQALINLMQQRGLADDTNPRVLPNPEQLSGEEEAISQDVQALFPAVNGRHITAILKGTFDPIHLARLAKRDNYLESSNNSTNVSMEDNRLTVKESRSFKDFKTFRDWSDGFITFVSIYLELFKLPLVSAAMLRFHGDVAQAADIYDFKSAILPLVIEWHDQRRRHNISNASAWWPLPQQFKDAFLKRPSTSVSTSNSTPSQSRQLCYANLRDGGCRSSRCQRVHIPKAELLRALNWTPNINSRPLADRVNKREQRERADNP